MPLYEFECPRGHRVEKLFSMSACPDHIVCKYEPFFSISGKPVEYCGLLAEKVWSIPGNIQIGQPTKVFVNNQTGEIFTPFSRYDKPPKGYHEKELKSPIERSRFEKEQQRRVDAENQLTSHVLDEMKADHRKKRHDDLKARMNAIQREEVEMPDGKKETVEYTLSHKDKALLGKAMERSKNKPKKEKKTDVKLAINHYNPSNMDQVK